MKRILVLVLFAFSMRSAAQTDALPIVINSSTTVFPLPVNQLETIIVTDNWKATAATRLVVNGKQLATARFQYWLVASWTPSYEGVHRLYAADDGKPDVPLSNEILLIVGSAAKRKQCGGGLLSAGGSEPAATAQEINEYMARWDTLNCYFMQPPRCPLEPKGLKNCTP